jgi:beta-mannanase
MVGSISAEQPEFALRTIYDGRHDDYIRRYARGIADTGLPLILRFAHEMNGTWYPWSEVQGWDGASVNGNSRGEYAKAWRHVHQIFEEEGANDFTVWLWAPNRMNRIPSQPDPAAFYPGDDVVDWIGMSGYHRQYDEAPTFGDTYGRTLPQLREAGRGKPIFLAEIGATEGNDNKAEWIDSLFDGLVANPDIIGFAWFNLTVTTTIDGERLTNDWRINSSGAPTKAMAEGLASTELGLPSG